MSQGSFFISPCDLYFFTSLVKSAHVLFSRSLSVYILLCGENHTIYTYEYPLNIAFMSSWNFSIELWILQPFVLGENVFGPKCLPCPFQLDGAETGQ